MDPDIFALKDVTPLLTRDMGGKAILARSGTPANSHHSSVMLLECSKLTQWDWDRQIDRLFNKEFDFQDWLELRLEDSTTIGPLEEKYNSFDKVTNETVLLHTTNPRTQPWKTGLVWKSSHMNNAKKTEADEFSNEKYLPNPDMWAEFTFLSLLDECLDSGFVTEAEINAGIAKGELRPDLVSAARNAKMILAKRRLGTLRRKLVRRASGILTRSAR